MAGRTRSASPPARRGPSAARLTFRPATAARWKDIVELFGERGACGGCWCMYLRRTSKAWEAGKGAGNRRAFRRLVVAGARPGVIAYDGARPVGWCAVAPRSEYPRLANSRVLAPVDDLPVWSVTCFFVLRPYRRRGVSAQLLLAAARFAASRGARLVEGYPQKPYAERSADAFLWRGSPTTFRRAGFREVARRSPSSPIMRKAIRAGR